MNWSLDFLAAEILANPFTGRSTLLSLENSLHRVTTQKDASFLHTVLLVVCVSLMVSKLYCVMLLLSYQVSSCYSYMSLVGNQNGVDKSL